MDFNCDIEMQDQGDKGDGNLEKGPTVAVQEEATPLLKKITAIEMQEQTEGTRAAPEQEPTVIVQVDIEEEKLTPIGEL